MLNRNGRYSAYCIVQLVILVLLAGCSSQGKAIMDLVPLSLRLEAEFEESSMVVELKDRDTLGVTVADAGTNGLTPDQAAQEAHSIASFVCENYRSMGEIAQVRVTFETQHDRYMVDSTRSATYTFENSELECDRK